MLQARFLGQLSKFKKSDICKIQLHYDFLQVTAFKFYL